MTLQTLIDKLPQMVMCETTLEFYKLVITPNGRRVNIYYAMETNNSWGIDLSNTIAFYERCYEDEYGQALNSLIIAINSLCEKDFKIIA